MGNGYGSQVGVQVRGGKGHGRDRVGWGGSMGPRLPGIVPCKNTTFPRATYVVGKNIFLIVLGKFPIFLVLRQL